MIGKVLIGAATTAVAATVVVTAAGEATTGPATIRITDRQTTYKFVQPGRTRAGAVELVQQALYNPSVTGRAIGRADMICTFLNRKVRACTATYFLPKGKIVVSGALATRLIYQAAVVGGTGLFDNARGTLTVTASGLRPRREVLVFRLAG